MASNSKISLSVVVPISLMADRLQNLESWLKEIPEEIEILIMHDIRDGETGLQLKRLISNLNHRNIELKESNFGSTGAARNAGASLATKDWLVFWDSDDLPNLQEFFELLRETINSGCEIGIGSFEVVDDKTFKNLATHMFVKDIDKNIDMICRNPGIWRFVFKKSRVNGLEFPSLRIGEEQVYIEELNLKSTKIFFSDRLVYKYFKGSSFHTSQKKKAIEDIIEASRISWNLIKLDTSINKNYKVNFFVRQIVSAVKNGNFKTKVQAIHILATRLLNSSFYEIKLIFKNLERVING